MAAARIQYALERTLPSLTSLEAQGLFTRDELRALTHQRSVHEASLVRRNVERRDFETYLTFEDRFERLRELRVKRLPEPLPPSESARARAEAAARSIAIWERGVKRLRGDVVFWHAYLRWVREKKMRTVAARVAARALALHPNVPALWIESADHELHANAAPAAARALLQRAIRLNARPHNSHGEEGVRPNKRIRTHAGSVEASAMGEEQQHATEPPPPPPSTRVAPKEAQLVVLWLEYVRMELVFLERLRRRWAVLGIAGAGAGGGERAVKDVEAGQGAAETAADEEEAVLAAVPTTDAEAATSAKSDATPAPASVTASPAASIVAGAIPLSILAGALDLSSKTSLPPSTHFVFLLALAQLVRSFPFLPAANEEKEKEGEDARKNLLDAIEAAFLARFPSHAVGHLYAAGRCILDTCIAPLDVEEEREHGAALQQHGKLISHSAEERLALLLSLPDASPHLTDAQRSTSLVVTHLTSLFLSAPTHVSLPHLARTTLDVLQANLARNPSGALFNASLDLLRLFGAASRVDEKLRAYFEGVAKRLISLARKNGAECATAVAAEHVLLALAALREKNEKEEASWKRLYKDAAKAVVLLRLREAEMEEGTQKLTQLLLAKVEIRQTIAKAARKGRGALEREWEDVLKVGREVEVVDEERLYTAWTLWVAGEAGAGKEGGKWARGVLESAIRLTRAHTTTHDHVVLAYLRLPLACTWDEQFAFLRAHARSSDAIWTYLLSAARASAGLSSPPSSSTSPEGEKTTQRKEWKNLEVTHQARLEQLYAYLGTREDASVAQRFEYVKFLYVDKRDVAGALTALRTARREVSEEERASLEALWEGVCAEMEEGGDEQEEEQAELEEE